MSEAYSPYPRELNTRTEAAKLCERVLVSHPYDSIDLSPVSSLSSPAADELLDWCDEWDIGLAEVDGDVAETLAVAAVHRVTTMSDETVRAENDGGAELPPTGDKKICGSIGCDNPADGQIIRDYRRVWTCVECKPTGADWVSSTVDD